MSNSNDALSALGLVSYVQSLAEMQRNTKEIFERVKLAEQAHASHLKGIADIKVRLGKHLEARDGRDEIVLVTVGDRQYAARVYLVPINSCEFETKVDFFTPRKI